MCVPGEGASTIAELTATEWDAEFRRTGQIVFPVRRGPVAVRTAITGALIALRAPNTILGRSEGTAWQVADWLVLGLLLVVFGYSLWQLATGRPAIVVSTEGIRRGRKLIPWPSIASMSFSNATGALKVASPTSSLLISRGNIRDLAMARGWLEHLRRERLS